MRDFILGIAAGAIANHLGYRLGRRHRPEKEKKDTSICSCEHAYSVHSHEGVCNVVTKKYKEHSWHSYRCPCLRYDGIPPAHVYMKDV